jgi:hypothetical protein
MNKKILSNRQGIKIPHKNMVELRRQGLLNLGIENDLSTQIAGQTNLGPKKTTAVTAFNFWNWVAISAFIFSIYWSVTKNWWWFIVGFLIMRLIWSANKKGNAKNFLDAAMIDKEFYERVLELNGWMYQVNQKDEILVRNIGLNESQIIADYGELMDRLDVTLTFYDTSVLPHPKHKIQEALINRYKITSEELMRSHLKNALFTTCNFIDGLKEPVTTSLNKHRILIEESGFTSNSFLSKSEAEITQEDKNKFESLAKILASDQSTENNEVYKQLLIKSQKEFKQVLHRLSD